MEVKLLRNASLIVAVNGKRILVDPMLSPKGTLPPTPFTKNRKMNPTVDLPVNLSFLNEIDAIVVTHKHFDHFDKTAKKVIRKDIPIFCQPCDKDYIESCGFYNVSGIDEIHTWEGITLTRTNARHAAQGVVNKLLGRVSGFIIDSEHEGSLYIVGDSIYYSEVEKTLKKYKPNYVVLNTAEARLFLGTLITMTCTDVTKVLETSPESKIIAVHMEAINHCTYSRRELARYCENHDILDKVFIPEDGESIQCIV